jgi:hypothetical protein
MPELARQHAIGLTTLSCWNARYTEPTFARVEIVDPPHTAALVVELAHILKGILPAYRGSKFNAAVCGLEVLRAACWRRARRYFFDAQAESPILAAEATVLICVLFAIKRGTNGGAPETRRRQCDTDTHVALLRIHDWLTRHVHGARPRSALGEAIQYTLNQWAVLAVCADHPDLPIHNNTSELRLRQAVTERKNLRGL